MKQTTPMDKKHFLYPIHPYHGQLTKERLLFNTDLQTFAHKVSFIANLHTGGKLSTQEAYNQIESLWEKLHLNR